MKRPCTDCFVPCHHHSYTVPNSDFFYTCCCGLLASLVVRRVETENQLSVPTTISTYYKVPQFNNNKMTMLTHCIHTLYIPKLIMSVLSGTLTNSNIAHFFPSYTKICRLTTNYEASSTTI